jgi:hypothetical protein
MYVYVYVCMYVCINMYVLCIYVHVCIYVCIMYMYSSSFNFRVSDGVSIIQVATHVCEV